jgi:DNA-directed RNA polymerase specialized sigma24 family protein
LNDTDLSRSQIENLIYEWIFNKRHRDILIDRLLEGMTFQDIAEKYDLSVQHTKRIIYKAEEKLFKHL